MYCVWHANRMRCLPNSVSVGIERVYTNYYESAKENLAHRREQMKPSKWGLDTLKRGLDTLKRGLDTLNRGLDTLNRGLDTLKRGLDTLNRGLDTLKRGLDTLKRGLDTLKRAFRDAQDCVIAGVRIAVDVDGACIP